MTRAILASGRRRSGIELGTLIEGNFQSYSSGAHSAWTGMWGHYLPQADELVAESSMRVVPEEFPNKTTFYWDVVQTDPDWTGVNGYLFVAYGNYDDSPGTITPRQVNNITALSVDTAWTFTGDNGTGLLCELWLSPAAVPTGTVTPKLFEIAFFPKSSPTAIAWLESTPAIGSGSFVDSNGKTWMVKESLGGDQPYIIAYPPGYADFKGILPFRDLFTFLISNGRITGDEWFNGVAFGPEPHHGKGSVRISKFAPAYA